MSTSIHAGTNTLTVQPYNTNGQPCGEKVSKNFEIISPFNRFTDPRDGNQYTIKNYGAAGIWMTQNLRYFHPSGQGMYIHDGAAYNAPVLKVTSMDDIHSIATAKNVIYKGSALTREDYTKKMGVAYNWNTAMNGSSQEGAQGIAPPGWHIPTDAELMALEMEIANNPSFGGTPGTWQAAWESQEAGYRGNHGARMKSAEEVFIGIATGGNNIAEFGILLNGKIYDDGNGTNWASSGSLWGSTTNGIGYASRRTFTNDDPGVYRSFYNKGYAFPIRCKMN